MRVMEAPTTPAPLAPTPGRGIVDVASADGHTYLSRLRAHSPLKLLTPRRFPHAACVIAGSYGGGLVDGDHLHLEVRVAANASLHLGTQASTKVYRSTGGRGCGQELSLRAETAATCVIAPDVVTPFEGSIYTQRQRFDLAADASLVLVDWMTAGRCARGERWAFSRYASRTDITVDGRAVFRDRLLLDTADGPLAGQVRTGGYECLATVVVIGPRVKTAVAGLLEHIARSPAGRGGPLVFAASPIAGGVVLRVAGMGTEVAGNWIKERLAFVGELLGENPWARKW